MPQHKFPRLTLGPQHKLSSPQYAILAMLARMHESCMHILDPVRSDHALYARTSTARTMHVRVAPYKMYEAPYILPYMTGNFRPTAQTQKPTVCLNFRPQYKSIVYLKQLLRYWILAVQQKIQHDYLGRYLGSAFVKYVSVAK